MTAPPADPLAHLLPAGPPFGPDWQDAAGPLYRVHGLERAPLGAPTLVLAGQALCQPPGTPGAAVLNDGDWLGGGTWRNSLYLGPWARWAPLDDLHLVVQARGVLQVRVSCAAPGRPAQTVARALWDLPEGGCRRLALPRPAELPPDGRLYWHVDAFGPVHLDDIAFATRTPPRRPARLAVMIRTFGRQADVQALLAGWQQSAAAEPALAATLDALCVRVLETGPGAGTGSARWPDGLDLRVWSGPNLGGGGNASHLMQLVAEEWPDDDASPRAPDEWLLLDDDLNVSLETVARYRAFCRWRTADVACSLPVLMKSRPTTVWEDGGVWGTDRPPPPGPGVRRTLMPTLLRHGVSLDGFEHLDDFGAPHEIEYATFIFFGLSRAAARRAGPPAAFFLRGDDVEWSLRLRSLGVPVVSNPNLCAWHEPGHSHAQEYMAVLHGVIVNWAWSDTPAAALRRFFEDRWLEHAATGDTAGLAVYRAVLHDLLREDSPVLDDDFAAHYPPRLAALNAVPMRPMGGAERADPALLCAGRDALAHPFVHGGLRRARDERQVVLSFNAGAATWRELPDTPLADRLDALHDLLALTARLEAEHDRWRAFWQARLTRASGWPFWVAVRRREAPRTSVVARHHPDAVWRQALPLPEPQADAWRPGGVASADALRQRLRRQLQALGDAAEEAPAPRPGSSPGPAPARPQAGGWWLRLLRWARPRAAPPPSAPPPLPLPADFDAEQYLALNVDVARSGIDAATHYLRFGRREGRRYRLLPAMPPPRRDAAAPAQPPAPGPALR